MEISRINEMLVDGMKILNRRLMTNMTITTLLGLERYLRSLIKIGLPSRSQNCPMVFNKDIQCFLTILN
jgi:hypothetical protein